MDTKQTKLRSVIRTLVEAEVQAQQAPQSGANTDQKLSRARVQLFFDELTRRPSLMQKLQNVTGPIEQAEVIVKFAELVGVPASKIPSIITTLRQMSRQK